MNIEQLKEKIATVRNDTNVYGYNDDNTNLADILEGIVEWLEQNATSSTPNEASQEEPTVFGNPFE